MIYKTSGEYSKSVKYLPESKRKNWLGIECIQSHAVVAKNTKKEPTPYIKIKFEEYQNVKERYWSIVLLTIYGCKSCGIKSK